MKSLRDISMLLTGAGLCLAITLAAYLAVTVPPVKPSAAKPAVTACQCCESGIKCECAPWIRGFEYTALHPDFEPLDLGCSPRRYMAQLTKIVGDDNNIAFMRTSWRRVA